VRGPEDARVEAARLEAALSQGSPLRDAQFQASRLRRFEFLLFPSTAFWWFERYPAFKDHLESQYREVMRDEQTCVIFDVRHSRSDDVQVEDAEYRRRGAPDGLPLPPPEMIAVVAAHFDARHYYEGGAVGAEAIRSMLERNGIDIEGLGSILDFGCGCGRTIRHWKDLHGAKLFGVDYNPYLIGWCKANLPFAQFRVNDLSSGLDFDDATFDFVYAKSIFTHMNEELQMFWMDELKRVLKPGGFLFITLQGVKLFQREKENLPHIAREQFESGRVAVVRDRLSGSNACAVFHPEAYVRQVLTKGLKIVDYVPEGSKDNIQDAILLQRPNLPATN